MIPPSVLMRMAVLGLTAEQAAEVADMLAAVETATKEEAGASIEARRRSDRERKQRQRHGMSRDVAGQDVTERDNPTPDKEKSPTPPKEINPTPSSLRSENKRGTRLPAGWALPAAWGQWAIDQGHSEATIRFEADKFRDFWVGKSGKDAAKLDWEATWRNWMRNVAKPRAQAQAPPRETENARHQREFREAIQQKLNGNPGHDEFASTGPAFDLEPGDYHAHRATGTGSR